MLSDSELGKAVAMITVEQLQGYLCVLPPGLALTPRAVLLLRSRPDGGKRLDYRSAQGSAKVLLPPPDFLARVGPNPTLLPPLRRLRSLLGHLSLQDQPKTAGWLHVAAS